jgi:phycocyanin-associated rod linker protein
VRVVQAPKLGKAARIRQSNQEYLVSYEQLSEKMQQINRQGGKITSITQA